MKKFGIKEVVATGIGTALFIVLTEVQIPLGIIPNTSMQPRAAVMAFLAAVFGPVVGGIIGLLGHALGDALFYGGVWWSWVFPDAIFGILVGLFAKSFEIKAGGFNKKKVILFNGHNHGLNGNLMWFRLLRMQSHGSLLHRCLIFSFMQSLQRKYSHRAYLRL